MAVARNLAKDEEAEGSPPAPNYRVAEQGEGRSCDACFHRRGDGMRCSKFAFGSRRGYRPDGVCDDYARRSVAQDKDQFYFDANLPQPETEVGEFGQTIANVEVFRAGQWNGDNYTGDDLEEIIAAFAKVGYVPPVKLGHDDDPTAPAYGWVQNLRRQDDTLVADFADVPDDMVEMIRDGRFDAVSSEIFFNLKRNGETFPRALKAVAILGAHPPGVSDLKPLRASLNAEMHAAGQVRVFTQENTRRSPMAEKTEKTEKKPAATSSGSSTAATPPVFDSTGAPIEAPGDANTVKALQERDGRIAELEQKIANLSAGVGDQTELALKFREAQHSLKEMQSFVEETRREKKALRQRAIISRCNIRAFQELFAPLAEMALDREEAGKTVTFAVRDNKGEITSTQATAVGIVEKLIDAINEKSAFLFGEVGGSSRDYAMAENGGAPNAARGGDPGVEMDRLVKRYQAEHPGTKYQAAFHAVASDPAYAEIVHAYNYQRN